MSPHLCLFRELGFESTTLFFFFGGWGGGGGGGFESTFLFFGGGGVFLKFCFVWVVVVVLV